jgi:hypothetical protein
VLADASPDGQVPAIQEFHFKKKNEVPEEGWMLEEEKVVVALRKKTKVNEAPDGRLSKIVRILLHVLGKPYLGEQNIQPLHEINRIEEVRLIRIQTREFHLLSCVLEGINFGPVLDHTHEEEEIQGGQE